MKSGEDEHERDGEKKKNNGIAYLVKTEIIPYLSHSKLSYCEITIILLTYISIDKIIPFSNNSVIYLHIKPNTVGYINKMRIRD